MHEPLIQDFRYRPEIDGLRALAVIAVILYHGRLGAPGGYVGVDIFFVISGYLITSLIVVDAQRGHFSPVRFWERRVRRILPPLVATVIATGLLGWIVLLPSDYRDLGWAALFQSLFAANFYFWRAIDYFHGAAAENPLIHTWSLAVEEQFYLLAPVALAVLGRARGRLPRRTVLSVITLAILASFACSVYTTRYHPQAAFYLMPSRAWELLLGSFVAFLPPVNLPRAVREPVCLGAILILLVPCIAYTRDTPFPGLAALPPCLGTALFIWVTATSSDSPMPRSAAFLCYGPVVFLGLLSYSLYLWHWPLLAFAKYVVEGFGHPFAGWMRIGIVLISIVLAAVSWRFIEQPIRQRRVLPRRTELFAASIVCVLFLLVSSIGLVHYRGVPSRWPSEALRYAAAAEDQGFVGSVSVQDVLLGRLPVIGSTAPGKPVSVLLWGDSQAMAAMPAFDTYLNRLGLAGRAVVHSNSPPLVGYWTTKPYGLGRENLQLSKAVLEYVRAHRVPYVVLVAAWSGYEAEAGQGSPPLSVALLDTVQTLRSLGTQPWVVAEVPRHSVDIPRLLAWSVRLDQDYSRWLGRPTETNGIYGHDSSLLRRLRRAGARILDPRPAFYDPNRNVFTVVKNGVVLYRDSLHLTPAGARIAFLPALQNAQAFVQASVRGQAAGRVDRAKGAHLASPRVAG